MARSADAARATSTAGVAKRAASRANKAVEAGITKPKLVKNVVSQATINKIKTDGMTAALKKVGAGKASATYTEGVKRMYGVARINAYKSKAANEAKSGRATSPYGFGGVGTPKKRGTSGGRKSAAM